MTTTTQPTTTVDPAALDELERLAQANCMYGVTFHAEKDDQDPPDWKVVNEVGGTICLYCTESEARFIAAACNLALPLVAQLRAEIAAREEAERELADAGIGAQYGTLAERVVILRGQRDVEDEAAEIALRNLEQSEDLFGIVEKERDEARQRATFAESALSATKSLVEFCAESRAAGNGACGACAWCCQKQGQRAERAEADAAELRAMLLKATPVIQADAAQYDGVYLAARALLARMDAERKDGVTHCNTCGEDVGAHTVQGVPVCACNVSDSKDGG